VRRVGVDGDGARFLDRFLVDIGDIEARENAVIAGRESIEMAVSVHISERDAVAMQRTAGGFGQRP